MTKKLFTPIIDVSPFIKGKNARKKMMKAIAVAINLQARGKELLQRRWTIGELHDLDKARKAEGYPPMYFAEEDC